MKPYNLGEQGAFLFLNGKFISATTCPSGKILPYKRGSTGRFSYVDEHGSLLVRLDENSILNFHEDDFSNVLDGEGTTFNLSNIPHSGTFIFFWNGIRLREGTSKDFTLSEKIINTNFIPHSGNSLIAKYFSKNCG